MAKPTTNTDLLDQPTRRLEDAFAKPAGGALANRPDEWSSHSPDILTRINEVTQALEKTSLNRVATKAAGQKVAH